MRVVAVGNKGDLLYQVQELRGGLHEVQELRVGVQYVYMM